MITAVRCLLKCLTVSQFLPSITSNIDSPFDTSIWLAHALPPLADPQYPRANEVELYIKRRYIKVPRFVRLLRQLRHDNSNEKLRYQVISLAKWMYGQTLEDWVEEVFDQGLARYSERHHMPTTDVETSTHTVTGSSDDRPYPAVPAIHFTTSRLYLRFLSYHELRCVLAGCIQTLCSIPSPSGATIPRCPFDINEARKHDIHAASMIAACEDYALNDPSPMKMRLSQLTWPLIYSYGTWHRLGQRYEADLLATALPLALSNNFTSTDQWQSLDRYRDMGIVNGELLVMNSSAADAESRAGLEMARCMKAWTVDMLEKSAAHWGNRSWQGDQLDWLVRVLAGGDIVS